MTLDLFESQQARDAALEQVTRREWMDSALTHADIYLRQHRGEQLRLEQVKEGIRDRIPEPHHENVWGALAKAISRKKLWKVVGVW